MKPSLSFSWLDLQRLNDYALDSADVCPLIQTLSDDLERQTQALIQSLERGDDAQALHRVLHGLKGMAGLLATPRLQQALTLADDACRRGDRVVGEPLARDVVPLLGL